MSDVQYSSGADAPEVIGVPRRARRLAQIAGGRASQARRSDGISEGKALAQVSLREGLYRRSLALADSHAALLALTVAVVWGAGADFEPWILLSMPVVVLVAKICGLYERDELVLKKTTLDEAPALV